MVLELGITFDSLDDAEACVREMRERGCTPSLSKGSLFSQDFLYRGCVQEFRHWLTEERDGSDPERDAFLTAFVSSLDYMEDLLTRELSGVAVGDAISLTGTITPGDASILTGVLLDAGLALQEGSTLRILATPCPSHLPVSLGLPPDLTLSPHLREASGVSLVTQATGEEEFTVTLDAMAFVRVEEEELRYILLLMGIDEERGAEILDEFSIKRTIVSSLLSFIEEEGAAPLSLLTETLSHIVLQEPGTTDEVRISLTPGIIGDIVGEMQRAGLLTGDDSSLTLP